MKITASVDSQLGDRSLGRGKTYDVKEQEAKHLIRAGLARPSAKNAKVEETLKAAKVNTPEDFQPGEDSAPSTAGGNTTVTNTAESKVDSTAPRANTTRKAGK